MSDELIQRLAGGIKEKDHRELLEKEHQLHRAKILKEGGSIFWASVCDSLAKSVANLKVALGTPGGDDLVFAKMHDSISIQKSECPYVRFSLVLKPILGSMEGNASKINPRPAKGKTPPSEKLRFEMVVSLEDRVSVNGEGKDFGSGEELADYILDKLFSV